MNWYYLYKFAFRNKNDLLALKISRDVFLVAIKNIGSEISTTINIEKKCNLFLHTNISSVDRLRYGNFDISANTNISKSGIFSPFINLELYFNKKFFKNDFEKLNYVLYDAIRHEIEHYRQSDDLNGDEFVRTDNILDNFKNFKNYILSTQEMDAYVRGLVFSAKKQKIPFDIILDNSLRELFFLNDLEVEKEILNSIIGRDVDSIVSEIRIRIIDKAKEIFKNLRLSK